MYVKIDFQSYRPLVLHQLLPANTEASNYNAHPFLIIDVILHVQRRLYQEMHRAVNDNVIHASQIYFRYK